MGDESLELCEAAIGYNFTNRAWLHKALIHSSNRIATGVSNERLEFLGDSILGMIVAEYLFHEYPQFSEGQLTKVKSVVVSRPVLARCANVLGLAKHILVGPGMTTDPLPETVVADCYEAIIAAIAIDGGMDAAKKFVLSNLEDEIDAVVEDRHEKNYKSLLQQYAQRKEGVTPSYRLLEESGPDHSKMFCVAAVISGRMAEPAWGPSKKAAEQLAAENAYKEMLARYESNGADNDA